MCDLCGLKVHPDQEAVILNRFIVLAPGEQGSEEDSTVAYMEPTKTAEYTWEPKGGVVTGLILHADTCLRDGVALKISEARALASPTEGEDPWQL